MPEDNLDLFSESVDILKVLTRDCPKDAPTYEPKGWRLPAKRLMERWKSAEQKCISRLQGLGHRASTSVALGQAFLAMLIHNDPQVASLAEDVMRFRRIPVVIYEVYYPDASGTAKELVLALEATLPRSAVALTRKLFEDLVTVCFVLTRGDEMCKPAHFLYHEPLYGYSKQLENLVKNSGYPLAAIVAKSCREQAAEEKDGAKSAIWNDCCRRHEGVFASWRLGPIPIEAQPPFSTPNQRGAFDKEKDTWQRLLHNYRDMCKKIDEQNERVSLTDWKFDEVYCFVYRDISRLVHGGPVPAGDSNIERDIGIHAGASSTLLGTLGPTGCAGALFFGELVKRICKLRNLTPTSAINKAFQRLREMLV